MIEMLITVFGISLVAIIVWKALPVLAALIGVWLAGWIFLRIVYIFDDIVQNRKKRRSDLIARAERQHQQLMEGDEIAGTYGDYPPCV